MPDVPTNGASNTQAGSQGLKQNAGTHSRDIEDIDRELEAYLEEKRSGRSVGYHHSVDEQLSQIREKFGARVTPTKESEKPKEVEVVQSSRDVRPLQKEEEVPEQGISQKPPTNNPAAPVLSHEELIRSLEEKYSRGESTNLPPKVPVSPKPESQHPKQEEEALPVKELNSTLVDFKESMEPINQSRVDALLGRAALLTPEEQRSLRETFLPRFKRNKERLELYTKTQTELEDELERFISNGGNTLRSQETKGEESLEKSPSSEVEPEQEPHDAPSDQKAEKPEKIEKVEKVETETPPQVKETPLASENAGSLEEKYRTYLLGLEKKPLVLVYEPENGFVRKQVDPNDSSLTLKYSLESATNTAVLTVYDAHGNELGVFKKPEKELDN